MHIKYPTWIFKSGNTGVSFPAAVSGEEGKNGMQTTNNNYRTSTTPYDGSSWFRVNSGVTAFYMDPRNWLTEERLFMFEKLDYADDLESQYPALVKSIFGTGTLSDDMYTIPMVNAGKTNRISPVHIASRIKQEVSANGSGSTNGGEFTWKGQTYSGFYNFFNIGAYAGTVDGIAVDAILRGRLYAAKLITRDGNLWNNIETSITEGSSFLANGYVNRGQGTLYYQKFNVGPNAYYSKYTHQYMTNVQAPAGEGNSAYNSYKNAGVLNQPFIFEIPIYNTSTNNFPPYTSLPKSGNTDNNLASLEVEGFAITPSFDKDVIAYDSYVTKSIDKINVITTTSSNLASISGSGEVLLTSDENVITIVVKSEAGEDKNYTINVHRVNDSTTVNDVLLNAPVKAEDTILSKLRNSTTVDSLQTLLIQNGAMGITFKNSSGTVITGNKVIGTNNTVTITTTTETKTFTVSVRGDTSGDGKVTILDLLEVQKHIKGASTLSGAKLSASDTSGDSKTTILDLLDIVKHIKGASPL